MGCGCGRKTAKVVGGNRAKMLQAKRKRMTTMLRKRQKKKIYI